MKGQKKQDEHTLYRSPHLTVVSDGTASTVLTLLIHWSRNWCHQNTTTQSEHRPHRYSGQEAEEHHIRSNWVGCWLRESFKELTFGYMRVPDDQV